MSTFKDFRGLAIPAEALALGFVDESWHNDAAARMTREYPDRRIRLTFWVGDETTAEEISGHRYAVDLGAYDPEWPEEPATDETPLYSGNDLGAALDALTSVVAILAAYPDRDLEYVATRFLGV